MRTFPAKAAIHLAGADKVFDNGVRALEPLTLRVADGEFATIVGPSGCGKSTLLRIVAGLIAPSSGRVRLWPDASESGEDARRLAFVFQNATLLAWADVESNVRLPFDLGRPMARSRADEAVRRTLSLVGLEDFRHAYPRELSGGMQMRVSIARALVTAPALLLMDEPFAALDEITRLRLDRELAEIWARERPTILFVTHSIFEAVFLSTRVLVMSPRPGRVVGEVAIDEPHPRAEAFRTTPRFAAHCGRLSALLGAAMAEAAP